MTLSEIIKKTATSDDKENITMLQFRMIVALSDDLGKFKEAMLFLHYPDMWKTEKEAADYIEILSDELDNYYDEDDPESWDCDEDEYVSRYSHLVNKAHEASEGDR